MKNLQNLLNRSRAGLKKYIQKMKYIFFIFSRILLRKLFITLHQKKENLYVKVGLKTILPI